MWDASFVIKGEPASKANSRRLVTFGGRPASIKSQKALNYTASFKLLCPKLAELLEGDLEVQITIFYASRRPDLDESVILDAMQGLIYSNDRQVKVKHVYWGIDQSNPRSEICIRRIAPVDGHDNKRLGRGRTSQQKAP